MLLSVDISFSTVGNYETPDMTAPYLQSGLGLQCLLRLVSEYLDYLVKFFSYCQPVIPVLYILYNITFQFSRTISQR